MIYKANTQMQMKKYIHNYITNTDERKRQRD